LSGEEGWCRPRPGRQDIVVESDAGADEADQQPLGFWVMGIDRVNHAKCSLSSSSLDMGVGRINHAKCSALFIVLHSWFWCPDVRFDSSMVYLYL
jgi:hypothetical protein